MNNDRREGQGQLIEGGGADLKGAKVKGIKGGRADLKRVKVKVKVKGMACKPMKRRPRAAAWRSCFLDCRQSTILNGACEVFTLYAPCSM